MLKFCKLHGLGNDYVLFDLTKSRKGVSARFIRDVCRRNFGIGADGVLLVLPSLKADFRMRIFNVDGTEAEMCGNGIRCVGKYVYDHKLTRKEKFTIETQSGIKTLVVSVKKGKAVAITVNMGAPVLNAAEVPVKSRRRVVRDEILRIGVWSGKMTCVSMGNPHCIFFVRDSADAPVLEMGQKIEKHRIFPRHTNVEFAQIVSRKEINLRVWERGVGETYACGTGACATVVAAVLNGKTGRKVEVNLPGGALKISWGNDNNVYMEGPAEEVFCGMIGTL